MTAHDPPEKTSPTEVTSSASLWRHHDFRQLWMGDTVSVFGVQFVSFAMPLIAVQLLHADAFEMGVLSTLESLAFLLIALPAGAWVDRMRKKHVLISGDVLRALVLLSIPAAWLLGALSFVHLCIVAALVGIITVFFDVANQSYLPEIVTGDRIAEGNGKLQASQQTANVIGPSAAAGLVALIGSPLTVGITSVCMGLSSLFVSRIRHREQAPSPTSRQPLLKEIRAGLAFVFSHSLLVRIVACTGTSNFSSSAIFALSTLYILRTLDQPQAVLGLVLSISAAGGLLGALAAPALQRIVGEGRTISLSALAGGLTFLNLPLASVLPPVPTLTVGGFLLSASVVVYNITQVSFRQRLCPKPLLGRMNASIRFLVWGPMPIGAFLGGVFGHSIGIVETLWVFAALAIVASLPVLLSPLTVMRTLPGALNLLEDGTRDGDEPDGRDRSGDCDPRQD
ncbi:MULTISPECIES: MFS transporter [Brevibacterium]|uniref:MFS transporter n=3 Tax=Brevibacterium TaxID=1696 RepID=A0A2A3ZES6_BREAU|nr:MULTISPECIES: MFS transporter [Brevibacterium]MDN5772562.1 MFS transporter [Brevibacterium aurantiacum]PCC43252.1 MFS transporter [Brevibacterium aurantiacum]PCC49997.1 MFS transporter [Brevibacterium aurantiacum]PCC54663.1 MFS transporter [Brevibacterium aurantiacum]SDS96624.1 Predicted arabinose efflux permease, MFS family [Brevibacterium sandarakinum]